GGVGDELQCSQTGFCANEGFLVTMTVQEDVPRPRVPTQFQPVLLSTPSDEFLEGEHIRGHKGGAVVAGQQVQVFVAQGEDTARLQPDNRDALCRKVNEVGE